MDFDFGTEIEKVLKVIPKTRRTLLFSATMTNKVEKLQRASLSSPVRIQVATKYSTVDTLMQYYLFFPFQVIYLDVNIRISTRNATLPIY